MLKPTIFIRSLSVSDKIAPVAQKDRATDS
jgi:hypothetical protein